MTTAMPPSIADLVDELKLDPSLTPLLEQALTHRAYADENGGLPSSERLEFLGDSVIAAAISRVLFDLFPDASEGELAGRRAEVLNRRSLAEVARQLRLDRYLRLGVVAEASGARTKDSTLGDAFDAVIGAVALHAGHDAAAAVAIRELGFQIHAAQRSVDELDPKGRLHQLCVNAGWPVPEYLTTSTGAGPDETFHTEVHVGDRIVGNGQASSRSAAERAASLEACRLLTDTQD